MEGTHLQVAKKKSMLAGWVLDKGACGKNYKTFQMQAMVSKSSGLYADWLSQKEAVDKYGKTQLEEMVKAGTIEFRRLKSDPRFWEFKAKTERESTVVHGHKQTTINTGGGKAISNDEVLAFSKMKTSMLVDGDFDFSASSSGSLSKNPLCIQDDLAKALNIKNDPIKKTPKGTPKNVWETMSQVQASETKGEIKNKLLMFKGALVKDHSELQKLAVQLKALGKKKEAMSCSKMADKVEVSYGALNSLIKQANPKKEDQKKALMNSYKIMTELKDSKKAYKKEVPKTKKAGKKSTEKEDEEGQGEEEEEEEEAEDAE